MSDQPAEPYVCFFCYTDDTIPTTLIPRERGGDDLECPKCHRMYFLNDAGHLQTRKTRVRMLKIPEPGDNYSDIITPMRALSPYDVGAATGTPSVQSIARQAVAEERQAIIDLIYSKFIGGASGDPTAVDIIEIIRERIQRDKKATS